jgi:hypothetical protein
VSVIYESGCGRIPIIYSSALLEGQAGTLRGDLRFDKIEFLSKRRLTEKQETYLRRYCVSLTCEFKKPAMRGPACGLSEMVRIVSPKSAALEFLSSKNYIVPASVEIALDIPTKDRREAEIWVSFFDRHFVQKWHGKSRCQQVEDGTYTKRRSSL